MRHSGTEYDRGLCEILEDGFSCFLETSVSDSVRPSTLGSQRWADSRQVPAHRMIYDQKNEQFWEVTVKVHAPPPSHKTRTVGERGRGVNT